jgi:hypothetical protein
MAKVNIIKNKMAIFMLCEAIGGETEKWKNLETDKDGFYDVNIQLNGREVDVERFLENLYRSYQEAVKKQAASLLSAEYDEIINKVHEIQECLEYQNELFEDKVFGR